MMENHSYDNFLGMLPRGDGFTLGSNGLPTASNPYANGQIQQAFEMPNTCQLHGSPSQEWETSHLAYANGKMNGFVSARLGTAPKTIGGAVTMGYWTRKHIPFLYSLADAYPVADRWFCSLLGQTTPNRKFLIAGTSGGETDDPTTNKSPAALQAFVNPVPNGTIFEMLTKHNITWTDYAALLNITSVTEEYDYGNDKTLLTSTHLKTHNALFSDAKAGTLPQFVFIDPTFGTTSQENPQNVVRGEAFMAQVIHALGSSPQWTSMLLILNYDEHGGYYDHVAPPVALAPDDIAPIVGTGEQTFDSFRRYGFRVPALVISPYSKPGYLSSTIYDHTSMLATVEQKWNLPALTSQRWRSH
jgi:phospholipase C